jgi:hypothetical protein
MIRCAEIRGSFYVFRATATDVFIFTMNTILRRFEQEQLNRQLMNDTHIDKHKPIFETLHEIYTRWQHTHALLRYKRGIRRVHRTTEAGWAAYSQGGIREYKEA